MEYLLLFAALLVLMLLLFLKGIFDERRKAKQLYKKMEENYGKRSERKIPHEEMESIRKLFLRHVNENSIDDITASDLELDELYEDMNHCSSACGDSYLYRLLRNPVDDEEKLNSFEKKVSFFENHKDERIEVQKTFLRIGKMRKISIYDCLDYFESVPSKKPVLNFLSILFLIATTVLTIFLPQAGVFALIVAVSVNILTYYKSRGEIEPYVVSFSYIVNFINNSKRITDLNLEIISDENNEITECRKSLSALTKGAGLVTGGGAKNTTGVGNPFEIIADYARMVLHLDIIKFYRMLNIVKKESKNIDRLYQVLGKIDTYVSVACYRASLPDYCVPSIGCGIHMKDGYHPLIKNPVKNDIDTEKGVLITGSNASGKSTFLKTVAVNALFARTIHTCSASSFETDKFSIFSSMALRDNLIGNDSYFMVEIKAMKRILDYKAQHNEKRILCFVDEVLRGTNTVERIAASTEILRNMANDGILCFAATHDGELTFLLEKEYENYHFEEEISDNDIYFSYKLNEGRATSRNAIKLLSVMGFSDEIVKKAEKSAEDFIEKGVWI